MKRRKHATYRCLGAGCGTQARLRVPAKTGPKVKPPGWRLTRTQAQDADGGVLRETAILFCQERCRLDTADSGDLAASIHAYLGQPGPPPELVVYRCIVCAGEAEIHKPQHRNNEPHLPEGWVGIPLPTVDYESGIQRCTTVPTCGEVCVKQIEAIDDDDEQPEIMQTELARVTAAMSFSWDDPVRV